METWTAPLMAALALPQYGLSTVFVVAFVSATLLPMGSEPAVFGLVKLNPELFWPAVLVGTAGNTLGRRLPVHGQRLCSWMFNVSNGSGTFTPESEVSATGASYH